MLILRINRNANAATIARRSSHAGSLLEATAQPEPFEPDEE